MRKTAWLCRHVLTKSEVVNIYIQGLNIAFRESIVVAVRLM